MAKLIRVALVGGSETIRSARRSRLEIDEQIQVVHNSDGFGLTPENLLQLNFDVAVLDAKLPSIPTQEYIRGVHTLANMHNSEIGRLLISASYKDPQSRLEAIEAGAVDLFSLEDGLEKVVELVKAASLVDADFGIREVLGAVDIGSVSKEQFSRASIALDTLDEKEKAIIKGFFELKTDTQLAQSVQVPKLKVRNTITKFQNLLLLHTRSQLLLELTRLGNSAF